MRASGRPAGAVLAVDPAAERPGAGAGGRDDPAVAGAVLGEAGAAAAEHVLGQPDDLVEHGQTRRHRR